MLIAAPACGAHFIVPRAFELFLEAVEDVTDVRLYALLLGKLSEAVRYGVANLLGGEAWELSPQNLQLVLGHCNVTACGGATADVEKGARSTQSHAAPCDKQPEHKRVTRRQCQRRLSILGVVDTGPSHLSTLTIRWRHCLLCPLPWHERDVGQWVVSVQKQRVGVELFHCVEKEPLGHTLLQPTIRAEPGIAQGVHAAHACLWRTYLSS
mmetsp:Transcript_65824/g.146967  ORF Transcript_65824/g.146967 Transcript_65824/m.146967 type:complete len:210 (-) Transcript_65824:735-1364(-)